MKQDSSPNPSRIHHFCVVSQLVSHIPRYKSSLLPDFASKYLLQYKDLVESPKDLSFLVDAFTKTKHNSRETYKIIEKKLNPKISQLGLEICEQLLVSAARRYENFSMIFLSVLAARLDKIYVSGQEFKRFSGVFAVNVINLMNIVRERDRSVVFEGYDNLIAAIENEKNINETEKK